MLRISMREMNEIVLPLLAEHRRNDLPIYWVPLERNSANQSQCEPKYQIEERCSNQDLAMSHIHPIANCIQGVQHSEIY